MSRYFDRDGKPMELMEWAMMFEENSNHRRVAEDTIGDVCVSTVWLGLDHQYGDGPPLIFETMIFGGPLDEHQWRYSTEAEAIDGHAVACAVVRAMAPEGA